MADPVSDEAFARAVNQMGAATLEHIDAAKAAQAEQAQNGVLISLADVLVQQGILTRAMRETIEKKLQAQQTGGVKQLGSYKLIKKLGEGGMGAVYLAEDTTMLRKVAVKVLPKKYASDPEFLTRFRREAKAAGKLNHVNIISAFTVGEELGNHFYVMEYCEGEPLDKMLKREGALPWDRAVEITIMVARGLQHAHEHGLIHRDIKPANIFMAAGSNSTLAPGREHSIAKILDMGLSKDIGGGEQSFNTQTGVALGTPHYISPEQAKGEKSVDGRTDIYSLGATLYHLVTGQTPFMGSTAAMIIMKHLTDQIPNPQDIREDIPDAVVQVIQKMMAKEAADRYANCTELLADLELVIDGKTPSSHVLDIGKSSIAMPRARKADAAAAADRMRAAKKGGTNRHEPVRGSPSGERPVSRAGMSPTKKSNSALVVAGGVCVLGLGVLLYALSGKPDSKPLAQPGNPSGSSETNYKPTINNTNTSASAVTVKPDLTGPKPAVTEVTDEWIKSVQAMPAEKQVEAVVTKLKELNPRFDPAASQEKHVIENGVVTQLDLRAIEVQDISPVRALAGLKALITGGIGGTEPKGSTLSDLSPLRGMQLRKLSLYRARVTDLLPLQGLPLTELNFDITPVSDLTPLRGMALLKLSCYQCRVSDLSPLKGMPLKSLVIFQTAVSDLSPVHEMPLEFISFGGCPVRDISPLRGTMLRSIECDPALAIEPQNRALLGSIQSLQFINKTPVAEFWVKNANSAPVLSAAETAWIKSVQALPAEEQVKRVVAKLQELNPGYDGKETHTIDGGRVTALNISSEALIDMSPVRALTGLRTLQFSGVFKDNRVYPCRLTDLSPLKGLALTKLNIGDSAVNDLSALKGMPLQSLNFTSAAVKDLSPLAGMPLRELGCSNNPISDLEPLRGMPLVSIGCMNTQVHDLSPLQNMPLKQINIHGSLKVTDLSPLKGMPLDGLVLGHTGITDFSAVLDIPLKSFEAYQPNRQVDLSVLRNHKTITQLNRMPVAEFWKKYPEAGATSSATEKVDDPARWKDAIDLLPLVDPQKDAVSGNWAFKNGELVSEAFPSAHVEVPYQPPAEYDLRVTFERQSGNKSIELIQSKAGKQFTWSMGGMDNTVFGFFFIGNTNRNSPASLKRSLNSGRVYAAIVQVRESGLTAYVDGERMAQWATNYSDLSLSSNWRLRDSLLGFGSDQGIGVFKSAKLLVIKGKGIFTRPDDPAAKEAKKKQDEVWAKNLQTAPAAPNGVLLKEDFDHLDLDKPPAGWQIDPKKRPQLSIVGEVGHGKVLRAARKGNDPDASIVIELDAAKLRGHKVTAGVMIRCPDGYTPKTVASWAGPRIGIHISPSMDGKGDWAKASDPAKREWHREQLAPCPVPNDAESVTLFFGAQGVDVEAFFDDLIVELDPEPNSQPPNGR